MATQEEIPKSIRSLLQPDIHSTKLILTELPTPTISEDSQNEHLILVHSTSPCSGELHWAANFPTLLPPTKLQVPCYDLSGVVVRAPKNSPFKPGSEIWTRTSAWRPGNAREYTIALTEELAFKPKNLNWDEAASIPLSAFTAWQALFVHGGLEASFQEGEEGWRRNGEKRVLIGAASGGVGVILLQLARAAGVGHIVGVCSTNNVDMVITLGAHETIDYRQQSISSYAPAESPSSKFDLAIDMLGGKSLSESWKVVKAGGKIISVREMPEERKPSEGVEEGIESKFFVMVSEGWQLGEVGKLVEKGMVKPVVDSVWEFGEFEKAFEVVDGGHAKGKVIIKVAA